ncbi:MAG: TetR/AcrR family transcriptional regulator [Devosia nanyangense]|uniref:TetR/AcrR family transcriptional regulator n=1 Tax=Devosia nanyangense TaxID=1228055 RepID=A0A933KZX9_9HYPH|nr:TetR/AcrR family transcriptional regulator [Devosia nanyangense]
MARAAALTKSKESLSRERIELAALELIEAEGLAAFSTRKLAARLGYEAMSIYHYFPSKGHLMDALIDHVIGELPPFPDASLPWLGRVRSLGRDVRRAFTRRPNLFVFVATHRMNTPRALAFLNRSIALFEEKLPHELAVRVFRSVSYYVMGASLDETAGYARGPSTVEPVSEETMQRDYPSVAAAEKFFKPAEFDETFELGWELMLTGIAALARRFEEQR